MVGDPSLCEAVKLVESRLGIVLRIVAHIDPVEDAEEACGARHVRSEGRRGHRWGRTQGKIGFHAGKIAVQRPRVRDLAGQEFVLPSWDRAVAEDWLGKWAMNLMLINVSTRKFRRAVRLRPLNVNHGSARSAKFNRARGNSMSRPWHA